MSRNCLRFHRHLPAAQPKWIRGEFYLRPSIAGDRTRIETKATVEMLIEENFIRGSLATFDRIGDVHRTQKLVGGETSTVACSEWNRVESKVENKQKLTRNPRKPIQTPHQLELLKLPKSNSKTPLKVSICWRRRRGDGNYSSCPIIHGWQGSRPGNV